MDVYTLTGLTDVIFAPGKDAQALSVNEAATGLNYSINDSRLAATDDIGVYALDPLAEDLSGTADTYSLSIDASLEGVDMDDADE